MATVKHASETWTRRLISNLEGAMLNAVATVNAYAQSVEAGLRRHVANRENPHGVTREQLGLGNVDNTADMDKPLSRPQGDALSRAVADAAAPKADKAKFAAFNAIMLPDGATQNQQAVALKAVIDALRNVALAAALAVAAPAFGDVTGGTQWGDVPPATRMGDVCRLFADVLGYADATNAIAGAVKVGETRDLSGVAAAGGVALNWIVGADTVVGVRVRDGRWRISTVDGDLATEAYAGERAVYAENSARAYADALYHSITNDVEVWEFSGDGVEPGAVYEVRYRWYDFDNMSYGWYEHSLYKNGVYLAGIAGSGSAHDEVDFYSVGIVARYVTSRNRLGLAYAKDVPDVSALNRAISGKADAASVNALAGTVNQWTTYWDGDDVRVTVTNYYGSLALPSLYLEQRMPADDTHDNFWFKVVWNEMTRWNDFLSGYASVTNELAQKADRAWGFYDSGTGEYSPDGFLQISTPNIIIAKDLAYQKTVTTGGCSMWVLTATQPFQLSGETEQGYFRITDGDGNALFEIVKGDKRIAGASASGLTMDGTSMVITYPVAGDQPTLSVCTDLKAADWQTGDEITVATVAWSGGSGNWVATVTPVGPRPSLFAKASYEVGGNTYIRNNVATSIDKVVVGGREYRVKVETMNGKQLLVLE